jgi:tRNA-2-methylthio-N6-dimethylallyladenosine synthase
MKLNSFFIKTFGCQMNENDSLQLSSLLEKKFNIKPSDNIQDADLVILNTCSVREKPEQKVFSEVGKIFKIKKHKDFILGIIGCVAQEYGEEIFKRNHLIDFVAGTHNIDKIPKIIEDILNGENHISLTAFYNEIKSLNIFTKPYDNAKVKAYVSIMQGCNNFCTYCIVPFVRGREYSREVADILDEIRYLSSIGVKDITLLGQNVNSYGKTLDKKVSFPELLKKVSEIDGIERIRFTTSHPKDFNKDLILAMKYSDKICKQIHLPVQSGSNRILKLMNRKYSREEYLKKISILQQEIPDIKITTDIIVGFPYETEQDFYETIDIVEKVKYLSSFSFLYSPRPKTKYEKVDNVPHMVKKERLTILQNLQKKITMDYNKKAEGEIFKVLVEGVSKKSDEELSGRTDDNRIVNFKGNKDLVGKFVKVKIVKGYQNSLKGEIYE